MSDEVYKHPKAINTMYFMLKHAYLTSDKNQAVFLLRCVKKALLSQSREIICEALTPPQMKDLKHLVYAIENNIYYCGFSSHEIDPSDLVNRIVGNVDSSLWYSDEKMLEDKMCESAHFNDLNEKLGINMKIIDRQFETQYGIIDILAQHDNTICIIELKKDVANHRLIGQVLKYALHFQKRLIYNLFDDIKIITIAGNYSDYAYDQLKLVGANTLTYSVNEDSVNLHVV